MIALAGCSGLWHHGRGRRKTGRAPAGGPGFIGLPIGGPPVGPGSPPGSPRPRSSCGIVRSTAGSPGPPSGTARDAVLRCSAPAGRYAADDDTTIGLRRRRVTAAAAGVRRGLSPTATTTTPAPTPADEGTAWPGASGRSLSAGQLPTRDEAADHSPSPPRPGVRERPPPNRTRWRWTASIEGNYCLPSLELLVAATRPSGRSAANDQMVDRDFVSAAAVQGRRRGHRLTRGPTVNPLRSRARAPA